MADYDQATILARMLEQLPQRYDISVGSVFRDLLATVAIELAAEYKDTVLEFEKCLIEKAINNDLDNLLNDFGFYRKSATKASGYVTFTGEPEAVIPFGTSVSTGLITYTTTRVGIIDNSRTVTVPIECSFAGESGNTAVDTVTIIPISIENIYSVTNEDAITGGSNVETDTELRARCTAYYSNSSTSGNAADYEAWAKEVDGVGFAKCIPVWNGGGTVKVIIADVDNRATNDLIDTVYNHISELDPVCAQLTVDTVAETDVIIKITDLQIDGSYSSTAVEKEIRTSCDDYFKSTNNGKIIYFGLVETIMSVSGIIDCTDISYKIDGVEYKSNYTLNDYTVAVLKDLEVL